jgi:hypothetical protein
LGLDNRRWQIGEQRRRGDEFYAGLTPNMTFSGSGWFSGPGEAAIFIMSLTGHPCIAYKDNNEVVRILCEYVSVALTGKESVW